MQFASLTPCRERRESQSPTGNGTGAPSQERAAICHDSHGPRYPRNALQLQSTLQPAAHEVVTHGNLQLVGGLRNWFKDTFTVKVFHELEARPRVGGQVSVSWEDLPNSPVLVFEP